MRHAQPLVPSPQSPVPSAEMCSGAVAGLGGSAGAEQCPRCPHDIAQPAAAYPAQRYADREPAHPKNALARLRARAARYSAHKIVADGLAAQAAGFLDGVQDLAYHRPHFASHASLLGNLACHGRSLVLAGLDPTFRQRPEAILLLDQQYLKLAGCRPAIDDTTGSRYRGLLLNRILHWSAHFEVQH